MYSDVFCKVYNVFGWNYYPEIFGQQLIKWLARQGRTPQTALDLACGTGVLCRQLKAAGIRAGGMDLSEGMIAIAKAADPEGTYHVADMTAYRPESPVDLVTCTGDSVNHLPSLAHLEAVFQNMFGSLTPGGCFVFDLLNEGEISDSEPFEMDMEDGSRIWFQMTRPDSQRVHLTVRVFRDGSLQVEQVIRENLYDPETVCSMLKKAGFPSVKLQNRLLEEDKPGTTWFVIAEK